MRYPSPKPGEWVQPEMRGYKLACCDCGLVHRMQFRIMSWQRGLFPRFKVQFRVWRDNRATGAVRRHKPGFRKADR